MKKYILMSSLMFTLLFATTFSVDGEEKKQKESLSLAKDAKSAILIEQDTGKVMFNKNEHEKLPPASMTKVMTLLLIMEAIDKGELKKDEMIRISERAASMGGSQIFLEAGEEMSVNDLLKGIAIASGNDASVALAERLAGSEEEFVKKMNEKVKELNLKNTHFQNTSGLPAKKHYSTSYDMAIIAKELLKYESITDYTSIYEDYLRKGKENEFWLVNTNKLVKSYPSVDGLKTGYTNEAKYCLTATAKKDDMRIIAVAMGAETTKKRNNAISEMLDYAYNHFETEKLYEKGKTITTIKDIKAENKNIDIVTSDSVSTLHRKGQSKENITTSTVLNDEINLPMKKGDQAGTLIVKKGDKVLSETPLVVNQEVKPASYLTLLKRSMQSMAKNR
ncbi:D-alanyl-D-alanine carboxypeptidase family protein [Virgibacillus alimentarius]|uniref:serine-type D-Ala-D-Ala carboxypeptidase n=1 Tax=Virgibacillus alimentarius TaxID=698769 RepID=A0ABS4S6B9_9BACI|nr:MULTISPECIES: D-alanyl-D-alanine carboxypeptidase family protein [Virgibacillus]MBP2256429.1 D-alanyl-D-alanine carboxypeptidase (penicillin-binding protein 5/6) [Virgibacillus alimentarius]HLR66374.1 D-alanyl-D-alanine carboxypeptidase family protein [Virgibacillus sp.]